MPAQIHRLFFALRPDAALLEDIERATRKLKAACHVRGRWLKPEKLHVTVQFLGDFPAVDGVVARACEGAVNVRCAPFEFTLDRVDTFPRRFNPPCVLRCAPASEEPLQVFARELANALAAAGLAEHLETRAYVPHLTVAYADSELPKPMEIAPICWQAHDFYLVDSSGGAHHAIARWPLRA
jgi:2'-5' RNA ligase